jgi:serine/threonine-protein kinase
MTAQARLLGGRYQVGELLGYGGMAEVHRGRDLRLGRDVAIKTLRHDLARDATFQMRFRREAQNAASLNHPAIVAVYDTGEEHGQHGEELPYIVMEFVNGRTLKEILTAEGPLMPRRALEIVADICSALEFSHRHQIIHRDVKPGNIMLTNTGQVKVMDFGIARALASGASTMTQTSAVIGTAQYLSPEQARGEAVDARSDVYATGCVLYELLCSEPPFTGDNPVSVAYQHVREDPRPPSDTNREVTGDIDAIVLKALAKNPVNRYQSAAEMRSDLLRAAAGRPVMATPVMSEAERTALIAPQAGGRQTQVVRSGPPARKRSSPAVVVLLTLLGVLAVVALGAGLWVSSHNGAEQVPVPDIRNKTVADARDTLARAGLTAAAGTRTTGANCPDGGQVTDQQPRPPARADKLSQVKYDFCVAPGSVPVPSLVGGTKDAAVAALKDKGLVPDLQPRDSDTTKDQVIETDPKVDTKVKPGSTVIVYYSLQNQAKLPDVRGLTREQAESRLQSAGFTVFGTPSEVIVTSPDQAGTVVSTNPPADQTLIKLDTRIQLRIGRFQQPTPTKSATPTPTTSASTGSG